MSAMMQAYVDSAVARQRPGIEDRVIGSVEHLVLLGSGGYGTVYSGTRRGSTQRLAVKVGNRSDTMCGNRIRNEFRLLNLVRHPNVVTPEKLGYDGSRWYFSMQLAGQLSLLDYIRGRLPGDSTVQLDRFQAFASQLASALTAIHRHELVFGDLKPANMRFDKAGHLLLFDFGSSARRGGRHCMPTHQGELECTFQYLAPETVLEGMCGSPSDIYAFGRICFELLTGVRANLDMLSARDPQAFESRVRHLFPRDTREDLREVICAMLAFDPHRRPKAEHLVEYFGGFPPEPPNWHPRSMKFFSKVRRAVAAATTEHGRGRMMLFVGNPLTCRQIAEGSLNHCGGDEPVLTIRGGDCSAERYPGAAWGGIADGLARWHHRLPAILQAGVRRQLGQPPLPYDQPGPETARQTCRALIEVSRQRPTVVVVERLDQADELSRQLLCELMPLLSQLKLVLVSTARTLDNVKWLESERTGA